jgi:hypothetical protein
MPNEPDLIPATREELVTALSYALRFDERGKAHRQASELTAQIAAHTLVRYLEMAGFVVMKRPPRRPSSTHGASDGTAPAPAGSLPDCPVVLSTPQFGLLTVT